MGRHYAVVVCLLSKMTRRELSIGLEKPRAREDARSLLFGITWCSCARSGRQSMTRIRRIRRRKINKIDPEAGRSDAGVESSVEDLVPGRVSRVVLVGDSVFNLRLSKIVASETEFRIVAMASTVRDAAAFPNEYDADLVVVDVDFQGTGEGINLARDLSERRPGCGFMLVCGPFTSAEAEALWVFGTDTWSVITQATAKSPAHFAEAVSSAVHGITWVEPGVQRELRAFGPRPSSFEARKLFMYDANRPQSAS